jgi:allophanate hydrolase subunit 2
LGGDAWANWLLGNLDAPVVEITLGGFSVVAEQDCVLALAGADLDARIDDQPVAPWRSFSWARGSAELAQPRQGARAYLAAPGGFTAEACWAVAPRWCAKPGWPGWQGRALLKGEALALPVSRASCAVPKRCARITPRSLCSTW